jgi:hypothetical protein
MVVNSYANRHDGTAKRKTQINEGLLKPVLEVTFPDFYQA